MSAKIRLVIPLLILLGTLVSGRAQPDRARLQDLTFLMGSSLAVPGTAAYCEKFVGKNPALMEAAQRWNQRHWRIMEAIVAKIKEAGGLSPDQKRQLDVAAFRALSREIEQESDKAAYCHDVARLIEEGHLDFLKRPDTASALS